MTRERRHAVMVRMSDATFKEFEHWRKKFDQDKSGFASLCVQAGIKSVVRGIEPESAMEPKAMANIIKLIMQGNKSKAMKPPRRKAEA